MSGVGLELYGTTITKLLIKGSIVFIKNSIGDFPVLLDPPMKEAFETNLLVSWD